MAESNETYARKNHRLPFADIPLDHSVIVLCPGERILAHAHEFVGIHAGLVAGSYEQGRNGMSAKYQTSSDLTELKRN